MCVGTYTCYMYALHTCMSTYVYMSIDVHGHILCVCTYAHNIHILTIHIYACIHICTYMYICYMNAYLRYVYMQTCMSVYVGIYECKNLFIY